MVKGYTAEEWRIKRQPTVDACIRMYGEGKNVNQIAEELKISNFTVIKYLKENGISRRGRKKYTYEFVMQLADEYLDGMTVRQLASKYNMTGSQISQLLYRYNVNRNGELTQKQKELLTYIYKYKLKRRMSPSLADLASEFQLNRSTMYDRLSVLENLGLITKDAYIARSIEFTDKGLKTLEDIGVI